MSTHLDPPVTPIDVFVERRRALLSRFSGPALLASGQHSPRNYPGNTYAFRASSHFLYFFRGQMPGAALLFAEGKTTLFMAPPTVDDAIWMGAVASLDEVRETQKLDAVLPLSELPARLSALGGGAAVATLPTQDAASAAWVSKMLGRPVEPGSAPRFAPDSLDAKLADAIIALRLKQDRGAVEQLRMVAEGTARAHVAGMRATRSCKFEYQVAAAMLAELGRMHLGTSYGPIVSIHGEVLHNEHHENPIRPGDLLLADVGGETPEGWAGDITRVWPVSGKFSPTQKTIYELVLQVEKQAVASVRKGVRYRSIHERAARALVEGLVSIGIYRGEVDGLLERGAATLFFPHGIGHILGLDVHDMEDLGDRAAYAPGRVRSTKFGDRSLRLDLDLQPGMAVTIEPGFYQIPALLASEAHVGPLGKDLDRSELARFSDVRGIRIEDDVLCTEGEPEIWTSSVPKDPDAIEALVTSG